MASGRVLVTGGSGFIGCNLVNSLVAQGREVLNLDIVTPRDPSGIAYWRKRDVMERDALHADLKEFKPEYVIHLAARCDLDGKTLEDYEVNRQGVQNIVDATNTVGTVKRAMYASSRLVFKIDHKPAHTFDYKATTVYGKSKIESEKIVLAQPESNVPWLLFRPTSIWGEWFDIPYKGFFLTVKSNRYLHPKGSTVLKSYGYIGNVVHELTTFLDCPLEDFNRKTLFVSDYDPISVLPWAREIQKCFGSKPIREVPYGLLKTAAILGDGLKKLGMKNPPLTSFRLDNLLTPFVYDMSEVKRIVGPAPFSLEEGTARTCEWMLKHDKA